MTVFVTVVWKIQLGNSPDKRPTISDFSESVAIEQDTNVICFIYRDEICNKTEDGPEKSCAEIVFGKQ